LVAPATGAVVLVRFPFSDLSSSKLRPAIVLASAGKGDCILCQVTSNPYSDPSSVELTNADFASGSLKRTSYARPTKLFTASEALLATTAGTLAPPAFRRVLDTIIGILEDAREGFTG
jgi:mRNA interferase MazF